MDPSTTLVTFLFETDPSVKSVQLIGSWDNFSKWYTMKHDTRRGRGQWRGCHSFKSISSGHESHAARPSRNGGLTMGHTYYYYYEIDGSVEIHDPARPSTTACPYLPGQTVNTLYVPIEQTLRSRSASISSLRQESYMTMDPDARFLTPVPPSSTLGRPALRRLGSASSFLHDRSSGRSRSVGPCWKQFFGRKLVSHLSDRPNTAGHDVAQQIDSVLSDSGSSFMLEGNRSRNISPKSLRPVLVNDDSPWKPATQGVFSPNIPSKLDDQIDEEDHDDDDNFATSAMTEIRVHGTSLSPSPLQRNASTCTVFQGVNHASSLTLTTKPDVEEETHNEFQVSTLTSTHHSSELDTDATEIAQCGWSSAASFSTSTSPISSHSLADGSACYYDSDNDDDILSNTDGDYLSYRSLSDVPTSEAFQRYSLPRHNVEDKVLDSVDSQLKGVSTAPILTGRESDLPVAVTNFLGEPIDTGLDDFVNELGLMAEGIGRSRG
ncbi:hypothetical protein E4U21_005087 [Claviceps maximensis]|nr:hypothetical protein E4U21_005087 [Claviceps maximensis]